MPLKAVIFDVYNTLFQNDNSYWIDVFGEICHIQNLPVPPDDLWNNWKSFEVGFRQTRTNMENPEKSPPFKTYQIAWKEAFASAFNVLGINGDPEHASQLSVDGMASRQPYEDTFLCLEYVRRNWKMSLLTNADNDFIMPILKQYGLSFDAVVTSEIARAYKPDPRVFNRILKETEVLAEDALYVGDTLFDDVHGAKLVGMKAAWLNRSGVDVDTRLISPDYEVAGLTELMDILGSLKEVS